MARRTDAKGQVVALDRLHVPLLVYRLRRQDLLAEAALPSARHQASQTDRRVAGYNPKIIVQVAIVEYLAFLNQREVLGEDLAGALHAHLLTFHFDTVLKQTRPDTQAGLEKPDILIACPEEGLDAAADG